jgi:hypothetical protein
MKHAKTMGLVAMTVAALMAFLGASSASGTVLCKVQGTGSPTGTTCPSGQAYPAKTVVEKRVITSSNLIFDSSYWRVECKKSTARWETSVGEAESITGPEGTFTASECNCEVKIMKAGSFSVTWIPGTHNGTLRSTGAEFSGTCSTIFGSVQCTYRTEKTDMGTLTGGNPAHEDIRGLLHKATTNPLCSEESLMTVEYEVVSPKPLFVAAHT